MTESINAAFLDLASVDPGDLLLDSLNSAADRVDLFASTTAAQLHENTRNCQIVITNKNRLNRDFFEQTAALKLVCLAATGYNNIDIPAAHDTGVIVCNVRNYATAAVAQHVFAGLLTLSTSQDAYRAEVKAGEWQKSWYFCPLNHPINQLSGQHMVIVGAGVLGTAVAELADSFGMRVSIAKRPGSGDEDTRPALRKLLPTADILSLHCPLNRATTDLLGKAELGLLPRHAIVVNTARGGIINETALAQALGDGTIGGAVIDVLSQEPPVDGNPLLAQGIPNLVLTPHTAWASRQARQTLIEEIAQNIQAFRSGSPRNVVMA